MSDKQETTILHIHDLYGSQACSKNFAKLHPWDNLQNSEVCRKLYSPLIASHLSNYHYHTKHSAMIRVVVYR